MSKLDELRKQLDKNETEIDSHLEMITCCVATIKDSAHMLKHARLKGNMIHATISHLNSLSVLIRQREKLADEIFEMVK